MGVMTIQYLKDNSKHTTFHYITFTDKRQCTLTDERACTLTDNRACTLTDVRDNARSLTAAT